MNVKGLLVLLAAVLVFILWMIVSAARAMGYDS